MIFNNKIIIIIIIDIIIDNFDISLAVISDFLRYFRSSTRKSAKRKCQ